jgi:hypothetical protein
MGDFSSVDGLFHGFSDGEGQIASNCLRHI